MVCKNWGRVLGLGLGLPGFLVLVLGAVSAVRSLSIFRSESSKPPPAAVIIICRAVEISVYKKVFFMRVSIVLVTIRLM